MPAIAPQWYALHVRSNQEQQVAQGLRLRGFEEFLPLYATRQRWSDRVREIQRPLFSGYVFCRLDVRERLPILQMPGVVSFVGCGRTPLAVDDAEMATLQTVTNAGAPTAPWPFLTIGQKIRIDRGSLRNIEGFIVEVKNRFRLVVSVGLLQRSVAVEIDRDSITPLSLPRPAAVPAHSCHSPATV